MEQGTLQTVGIVAGIVGTVVLVALWIFRGVVRRNSFPTMPEDGGLLGSTRTLMVLATVVALAGIGLWTFAQGGGAPQRDEIRKLTVKVSRVELDWEGAAAAVKEFEGAEPGEVADSAIGDAARWIVERLAAEGAMSPHERVTVAVKVPSDLAAENPTVTITPQVEWEAFAAVEGGGGKSRAPVGDSKSGWRPAGTWRPQAETWVLQIAPKGHQEVGIELSAELPSPRTLPVPCPRLPARIALRDADLTAEPAANRVVMLLAMDERLKLTSPDALAALRAEIAKAALTGERAEQSTIRSRLGVDYIVTCSVR